MTIQRIEARTQGYSADETILRFWVAVSRCGDITDGVTVDIGGRAGFVIPWDALEKAYKANAKIRSESTGDPK